MNTKIMNTQILKVTKGHFYVYFNLNLRSYGQLFVLVYFYLSTFRLEIYVDVIFSPFINHFKEKIFL